MNSAVFKVVKEEIANNLLQVEQCLDAFARDPRQTQRLVDAASVMDRMRGTFVLIEDSAAALLSQALAEQLQWLVTAQPDQKRIELASNSVLLIGRYIDYRQLGQAERPELLLLHINRLHRSLAKPCLPEDYFQQLDLPKQIKAEAPLQLESLVERQWLQQKLIFFRSGLLMLIQSQQRKKPVMLAMSELCGRIGRQLDLHSVSPLMLALSAVLDDRSELDGWLSVERSRLLASVERMLNRLASGRSVSPLEFNNQLRQWLFLLRLSPEPSALGLSLIAKLGLPALPYNDLSLIEENRILLGPGNSVMMSVAQAMVDEIEEMKATIDRAEREALELNRSELDLRLRKISEALAMVGMSSTQNLVTRLRQFIRQNNDLGQGAALASLAEQLLSIEAAVSRLAYKVESNQQFSQAKSAAAQILREARVCIIDQSEQNLAHIKRSISAHELSKDPMHLANLDVSIEGMRGAMVFLDAHLAVQLLQAAGQFIQDWLLTGRASADQYQHFAELLTSLEFYLEALLSHTPKAEQLLTLGQKSMQALGYSLAAK